MQRDISLRGISQAVQSLSRAVAPPVCLVLEAMAVGHSYHHADRWDGTHRVEKAKVLRRLSVRAGEIGGACTSSCSIAGVCEAKPICAVLPMPGRPHTSMPLKD
ncbi:hypothetical protein [Rhizobium laguerreae]|uniref:hypothetical protein n=1 Tax=Rhizobium laguerreae TaxID=1076926 RepID=UPI00104EE161|nr:hypothetical protein [Rhizobium laguerreae]NKM28258.1 hypothetical protein [Rhizobium laguerreae]